MKIRLLFLFILINSPSFPQFLGDRSYGIASFYAGKFTGKSTANGEKFTHKYFTAAHKTYPFNSLVEVTNLKNNKKVIVRINDRGPFVRGRIIDLNKAAAKEIGLMGRGTVPVKITIIGLNRKEMLIPQNEFSVKKGLKMSGKLFQKSKIESVESYKKSNNHKKEIKNQLRLRRRKILS